MDITIPIEVDLHTKITESGATEDTSLSSSGTLYRKNDTVYLRYEEVINGTDKVNTTIKIQNDDITIIRQGAVSMRQRFAPGVEKEGTYESPYGPIQIATRTEKVDFDWNEAEKKGHLSLDYQVLFQGEESGYHQMLIKLRGEER
ncbi:DUF1934 domain-containing protein [Alkalihalobacillus sp. TS-13]|uniref:DUF1934 domain-containing protein n=1 Tax=Alkalihalobacillus sp. TS-13 TaxID=2842455 RepID=UPI001C86A994|nr:DUF1934 domain-containing protein [Alkalihalobacillus sp. TS-13]